MARKAHKGARRAEATQLPKKKATRKKAAVSSTKKSVKKATRKKAAVSSTKKSVKKATRKKAAVSSTKKSVKMTATSSKKKTLRKAGTVSRARTKTSQKLRKLTTSARLPVVGKIVKRRVTAAEAKVIADRKRAEAALVLSKAAERVAGEKQSKNYEKAASYFNNRKFPQALQWFEKVIKGPDSTLRHRAEVYIRICTERLKVRKIRLRSADDYYNYGVKLINDRELEEAERCLTKALKLSADGDHIHYAAAVVRALRGDEDVAFESLRRAIVLNDRNRLMARTDGDLSSLKDHPDWDALIFPDESDQPDS